MRMPIKISEELVPRRLRPFVPHRANPRLLINGRPPRDRYAARRWFSQRVTGVLVDRVWRATAPGRHALSDQMLLRYLGDKPVIVDVGISDGVTSLELLEKLEGNFTDYYAVDRLLEIEFVRRGYRAWFLRDSVCVATSTPFFTVYAETDSALPPLAALARRLTRVPRDLPVERLSLLQPELVRRADADNNLHLLEHDLFDDWTGPRADVIKVGNLLNRVYFSDAKLLRALQILRGMLVENGLLLLIDNRVTVEQSTLYRLVKSRLVPVDQIGAGTDIADLVQS